MAINPIEKMDKQLLAHMNWGLLLLMLVLFLIGIANLFSAGALLGEDGLTVRNFYQKQLLWGAGGLALMLFTILIDYRHLKNTALFLYIAAVVLLALVLAVGTVNSGARRWIALGLFNFQPSEVSKITVLLLGALFLARGKEPLGLIELLIAMGIAAFPALLIMAEPDLGTALNILLIMGGLILFRGIKTWIIVTASVLSVVLGSLYFFAVKAAMLPSLWDLLHGYQKKRIMTFLDPDTDPTGSGYHIKQALIAIGSGQLWGRGYLEGPQSKLRYLPERHTDFAIAVFGEEWGFVGCVALMAIFCLFLLAIFTTVRDAKDRFGSYVTAGVFFYFFWQILINTGMVLGLLPVVGIPLPFISYGGSATLVNFCLVGLVLNVSMRRFVFKNK